MRSELSTRTVKGASLRANRLINRFMVLVLLVAVQKRTQRPRSPGQLAKLLWLDVSVGLKAPDRGVVIV